MSVLIAFLVAILNVIFGLFVFLKNPRGATHRYFLFLTIVVACWTVTNYFSVQMVSTDQTLFWIRVVMVATSFLGLAIFLLVRAFPGTEIDLHKNVRLGLWMASLTSALLAVSPFMFVSVAFVDGQIQPAPGPALAFFAINFFGNLGAAFITLIRKFRRSKGLERLQLRYLIAGIVVSFSLLTITNLIIVVLLNISSFVAFGPMFTLFFIGSIGYAVIRHRFLDINMLVARSLAYAMLVIILAGFYTTALFGIQHFLLGQKSAEKDTLISTILTLIIVFTLQPLKLALEKFTEKIFFRHQYNSDQLVGQISDIATNELNLETLLEGVMSTLATEMRLSSIVTILANGHIRIFRTKEDAGVFCNLQINSEKMALKRRLDIMSHHGKDAVVVFDELNESATKKMLRNLNVALVTPLVVNKEVIGHLLSASKLSGDAFNAQDLRIFELTAPQVAISIKNASSFEEIRRFNIKLSSEVSRATKNLRHANSRLKELDKLKDDFVSVASHELRTPMTAIKSFLWMVLAGKAGPTSVKLKHYVQRSYDSTERLIKLVNDMLNVSRIEAGRISLTLKKTNLVVLAEEVIEELKARAQELKLRVVLDKSTYKQLEHVWVVADDEKIKEVLLNFVGNSLKFTPPNGGITIGFLTENNTVTTFVRDTGAGMDKENLSHLFEKFGLMQGSYRTNHEGAQGTGLGLFICKSIIEMHEGAVWAESPGLDKGSTFNFSLPKYTPQTLSELRAKHPPNSDVTIIHRTV